MHPYCTSGKYYVLWYYIRGGITQGSVRLGFTSAPAARAKEKIGLRGGTGGERFFPEKLEKEKEKKKKQTRKLQGRHAWFPGC